MVDLPSLFAPTWTSALQPASWRGLHFVVTATEPTDGRAVVVHTYPYREGAACWAEDLGRAVQRIPVDGYIFGDDVYAQRDAMKKACAVSGPGTLVHPSLGKMQAVLLSSTFAEKAEDGRVVHLDLMFVISGNQLYPGQFPVIGSNTQSAAQAAGGNGLFAAIRDFASSTIAAVQHGFAVVSAALGPVLEVAGLAIAGVSIASAAISAVRGLGSTLASGSSYGRYTGNLSGPNPALTSLAASLSGPALAQAAIAAAIALATTNRTEVQTSAAAAEAAVGNLSTASSAFVTALFALTETVRTSIVDPADQIQRLVSICQYTSGATIPGSSPINTGIAIVSIAVASAARRAGLASMANATAAYQPTSSTETAAIVTQVAALYDAEITEAADVGDLNSYNALRQMRTAVVLDLQTRGSQLPPLITIARTVSLPSLVLAYQLYQDANRSDDLIARANPPNPLFMPRSFVALSA